MAKQKKACPDCNQKFTRVAAHARWCDRNARPDHELEAKLVTRPQLSLRDRIQKMHDTITSLEDMIS